MSNLQLFPEMKMNKTTDPQRVSCLCCWYINSDIFLKKDINPEEENEDALF